jgi:hypothetical protein
MATTPTTPTIPSPAAPAAPGLVLPIGITFYRPRPIRVVLVGAGGTGARVASDLARLLTRGDTLHIIDPDIVEEKNLLRQHFVRNDLGKFKAEVVGRRAALAAQPGVEVTFEITSLQSPRAWATDNVSNAPGGATLWIGAVDVRNLRRQAALDLLTMSNHLWIDAGNELRGGQVGLMGVWRITALEGASAPVMTQMKRHLAAVRENARERNGPEAMGDFPTLYLNTLAEITPAVLQPDPTAEAATVPCGFRLDTQTLAANVMAASSVINMASRVLDGLPIAVGGTFFSTANTMQGRPFAKVTVNGYDGVFCASTVPTFPGVGRASEWAAYVKGLIGAL